MPALYSLEAIEDPVDLAWFVYKARCDLIKSVELKIQTNAHGM